MANPTQIEFLTRARAAAQNSSHPFPDYAACEAALESNYGRSQLAIQGNNLFGRKQSINPIYETLDMHTQEFLNGEWVSVIAHWVKYPDWATCFTDRVATLHRLAGTYPHYARALAAPDGETFVREVSQTWSTDPNRADKVLAIYEANQQALQEQAA